MHNSLEATNDRAKQLGAEFYYDDMITSGPSYAIRSIHMFRHYFNRSRLEVCYCTIPLLQFQESGHVVTFETPRVWTIPYSLKPL